MKNGNFIFTAVVAAWLSLFGTVWAEEANQSSQESDGSATAPANELLMYFDEKDLVTATKRSTSLRKAPAIATIITADEIRNMGARNMLDILKMVPGFGVSRGEFGLHFVEMRGIRSSLSEKILVMLDGHPLNKNYTDSAIYAIADMLPVENIKQVEVIRGPGSALYGNSAFLATINIISRDAEEIDGLEVKGGGGPFDTYKMNLVGGKTIGDSFAVSGSIDHFRTDGQKLTVAADALTVAGPPLNMFSKAPGHADLGFSQTDAYLKATYGDLSFRGHYLGKRIGSYVGYNFALANDSYDDLKNYWTELAYDLQIREGLSTNIKLHFDSYSQDAQLKLYPNGFGGSFPEGVTGRPLLKNQTVGIEQQIDWDLFKGNHLIAGASFEELRQYDVKELVNFNPMTMAYIGPIQELPGFNWNRNVKRRVWAAYLQDEWQLVERVNLTSGVRYDHYSNFGDSLNPRVGLVWNFLDSADLKILYGQAFRAPNFIELYSENNPKFVGNPNLKPEIIKTYEAGLVYRLNRYFAADVNYYYSMITDQIVWDGSTLPARNMNIGKTVTQGVELGGSGKITDELQWKLAYTYQDPRDDLTGKRLPNVPTERASGSLNYAPVKYLNLHTDLLWTGPRQRAVGDNRSEMPSYTTVDFAMTLKNFFKTLEIQAAVHNIFDKRFSDPDTSEAMKLVPGDFPREGISVTVVASYKF